MKRFFFGASNWSTPSLRRRLRDLTLGILLTSAASAGPVTLSWRDNSNNESGFVIERAVGSGPFALLTSVDRNVTGYSDATVVASTPYSYRVAAVNAEGMSAYSEVVQVVAGGTNSAPSMSNIPDQSIAEDAATEAIPFTIDDASTPAANVIVTATSSNPALVSNTAIVLGGSGANRTVQVTPAANQAGLATITVVVSDGILSATDSFVVAVTAVNDAPWVAPIAAQTIAAGTSTAPLAFTIADVETPPAALLLTASSSNPTLVPLTNVVFGGTNGARTITVTPAAGLSGSATITVTASDGVLSASSSFLLTVTVPIAPTNTPPTLSNIADLTIRKGTTTGPIAFVIGDNQTPAANLRLSARSSNKKLVADASIALAGSGANRTVTISPAANRTGSATITLTVSDGTLAASDTFVLTVSSQVVVAMTPESSRAQDGIEPSTDDGSVPLDRAMLELVGPERSLNSDFVVEGGDARRVLLRAIGPGLRVFGVDDALAQPVLRLFDLSGRMLLEQRGWNGDAELKMMFARLGKFPLTDDSADAAVVVSLPAGTYAVQVLTADGTSGTTLLEVSYAGERAPSSRPRPWPSERKNTLLR